MEVQYLLLDWSLLMSKRSHTLSNNQMSPKQGLRLQLRTPFAQLHRFVGINVNGAVANQNLLEVSYQDNYSNPVEDLNKSFADTSLSSNQASSFHTYPSADNHFPQNSHAPVSVNQLGYSVDFATAPVSQSINGSKSNGPSFSGPSEQSLMPLRLCL